MSNPLGLIPNEIWEGPLAVFWFTGLITLVLSSIASLFLRYRKANQVVRQQIKWLLFAVAIFASIYIYTGFTILILNPSNISPTANPSPPNLANLVFNLAVLVIPAAIAVSILRYRLYDIDLIIRRTLQYSLLTGLLSLVYFGGVALLQGLLSAFDGQSSPVVIVLTTLMIAALFNPLRRRLQDFIDRRFYRRKYDAERALADFATKARSETDMGHLSSEIVRVAQETMQPERVSLWLKQ